MSKYYRFGCSADTNFEVGDYFFILGSFINDNETLDQVYYDEVGNLSRSYSIGIVDSTITIMENFPHQELNVSGSITGFYLKFDVYHNGTNIVYNNSYIMYENGVKIVDQSGIIGSLPIPILPVFKVRYNTRNNNLKVYMTDENDVDVVLFEKDIIFSDEYLLTPAVFLSGQIDDNNDYPRAFADFDPADKPEGTIGLTKDIIEKVPTNITKEYTHRIFRVEGNEVIKGKRLETDNIVTFNVDGVPIKIGESALREGGYKRLLTGNAIELPTLVFNEEIDERLVTNPQTGGSLVWGGSPEYNMYEELLLQDSPPMGVASNDSFPICDGVDYYTEIRNNSGNPALMAGFLLPNPAWGGVNDQVEMKYISAVVIIVAEGSARVVGNQFIGTVPQPFGDNSDDNTIYFKLKYKGSENLLEIGFVDNSSQVKTVLVSDVIPEEFITAGEFFFSVVALSDCNSVWNIGKHPFVIENHPTGLARVPVEIVPYSGVFINRGTFDIVNGWPDVADLNIKAGDLFYTNAKGNIGSISFNKNDGFYYTGFGWQRITSATGGGLAFAGIWYPLDHPAPSSAIDEDSPDALYSYVQGDYVEPPATVPYSATLPTLPNDNFPNNCLLRIAERGLSKNNNTYVNSSTAARSEIFNSKSFTEFYTQQRINANDVFININDKWQLFSRNTPPVDPRYNYSRPESTAVYIGENAETYYPPILDNYGYGGITRDYNKLTTFTNPITYDDIYSPPNEYAVFRHIAQISISRTSNYATYIFSSAPLDGVNANSVTRYSGHGKGIKLSFYNNGPSISIAGSCLESGYTLNGNTGIWYLVNEPRENAIIDVVAQFKINASNSGLIMFHIFANGEYVGYLVDNVFSSGDDWKIYTNVYQDGSAHRINMGEQSFEYSYESLSTHTFLTSYSIYGGLEDQFPDDIFHSRLAYKQLLPNGSYTSTSSGGASGNYKIHPTYLDDPIPNSIYPLNATYYVQNTITGGFSNILQYNASSDPDSMRYALKNIGAVELTDRTQAGAVEGDTITFIGDFNDGIHSSGRKACTIIVGEFLRWTYNTEDAIDFTTSNNAKYFNTYFLTAGSKVVFKFIEGYWNIVEEDIKSYVTSGYYNSSTFQYFVYLAAQTTGCVRFPLEVGYGAFSDHSLLQIGNTGTCPVSFLVGSKLTFDLDKPLAILSYGVNNVTVKMYSPDGSTPNAYINDNQTFPVSRNPNLAKYGSTVEIFFESYDSNTSTITCTLQETFKVNTALVAKLDNIGKITYYNGLYSTPAPELYVNNEFWECSIGGSTFSLIEVSGGTVSEIGSGVWDYTYFPIGFTRYINPRAVNSPSTFTLASGHQTIQNDECDLTLVNNVCMKITRMGSATWLVERMSSMKQYNATWTATGAISTPVNVVYVKANNGGTIRSVDILTAGGSGSCEVELWKNSTFPITSADKISGTDPVVISSGTNVIKSTFTGWDTTINKDDYIAIKLNSTSTFDYISVMINVEEPSTIK